MANPHSTFAAETMTKHPFVTIVMPIRNEAGYIEQSLGAILAQTYPSERFEIIISDGMSTDGTREFIQSLTVANLILLNNPEKIVPTGLNMAVRQAKGDIIVRIDGHTIIEPDYVYQCVAALKRSGAGNVGGPMRAMGKGLIAEAIALATSSPFGIGNSAFHYSNQEQFVDTVYMGAFPKQVLLEVGLFNEQFVRHQDYELNYRIRQSGRKILLTPQIRSHYYVRSSLLALWRQYWQYGLWKGRFLRQHPASLKLRHMIPPLFVLSVLAFALASLFFSWSFWILTVILFLYSFFIVLAAINVSHKVGTVKYSLILPIILIYLHTSWGLGVWRGLFSRMV